MAVQDSRVCTDVKDQGSSAWNVSAKDADRKHSDSWIKISGKNRMKGIVMTVAELEKFLKSVTNKKANVYFYRTGEDPFEIGSAIENAFEVSSDAANTGTFEGVYLKGN